MNSSRHILLPALLLALIPAVFASCGSEDLQETELSINGHVLTVEIAATPEERQNGLMNRRSMPENHGMFFVFEHEQMMSFWMKDTRIPLSIAFIAADGTIRQIEDMEPGSLASVPSHRSVLYALEVNQGWFDARGISPGDVVQIPSDIGSP